MVSVRLGTRATLRIGAPRFGGNSPSDRAVQKARLLTAIEPLKRGLVASEEEQDEVDSLARSVERLNPTARPLTSDLINGQWKLVYTTSESILGKRKNKLLQPRGPIFQTLDAISGRARNQETSPLFNGVDAELTPDGTSNVKVQFKTFWIFGLIPIKAPETARGELEITYLDGDMRICRGDKGNLFVLLMEDSSVRLNRKEGKGSDGGDVEQ
ncbi:plastid lipid-associated fibrillin [Chloropicon primus]|uniref:Plastid lipid-associated fibrillin n=1 Tax=Chloropicon primus TaxID=1764295 RepID=A0A5B8MGW8_9CHLO|nr:plastid lipid-associated fibrillin [Chloropicon primus]UPQ98859.1 plastid lipid-associated fibrillin [Chloropicon primus]|eukprot:QDZ19647.1 plastid lipid-associated fibrillin [Chloropicon primus]